MRRVVQPTFWKSTQGTAIAIGCSVAVLVLIRAIWIAIRGQDAIVQFMGDDAYYYFVLARNFARLGHWTFDGIAPATGFHIIWAYLLVGIMALVPSISAMTLFVVASLISTASYAISALIMSYVVISYYGRLSGVAVPLVLGSASLLYTSTIGVEAPFVLLCGSVACYLAFMPHLVGRAGARLAMSALAGCVGSLARSDFGLFPVCLLAAQAIPLPLMSRDANFGIQKRADVLTAITLSLGAAVGVALVTLHCWIVSGSFLQHSALMKAFWAKSLGSSFRDAAAIALSSITPRIVTGKWGIVESALLASLAVAGMSSAILRRHDLRIPLAGSTAILGYICLYMFDAAVQPWYAATFAVPMIMVSGATVGATSWFERRHMLVAWILCSSVVLCLSGAMLYSSRPLWPHQLAMRNAGYALAREDATETIGAWNAGIISFFAERPIVNLDGLVNDDIYSFAVTGQLADYISERRISTIVDFSRMLDSPRFQQRGGYADGRLISCIQQKRNFSDAAATLRWGNTDLIEYHVDEDCLIGLKTRS